MDRLDPQRRSWLMSRVRSKNTLPELAVRSAAHRLGLRFRLHRNDLPGKPDLVFPGRRCIVFVHGCFWHRHQGCRCTTTPKTRRAFWQAKFHANVARDQANLRKLRRMGWRVLVVWQCQTKDETRLAQRLRRFFDVPE